MYVLSQLSLMIAVIYYGLQVMQSVTSCVERKKRIISNGTGDLYSGELILSVERSPKRLVIDASLPLNY